MILIENDQNNIAINIKQLEKHTHTILSDLGYHDFDIGIMLTTNAHIKQRNKFFRGKDMPTDILSFPFYQNIKAGDRITAQEDEAKNLGDIIISPEFVYNDLERWGQSFDERMRVLIVHGICHLLGYDHIKDEDYVVMKKEEERLLKLIS